MINVEELGIKLKGTVTPVSTPFSKDGKVDYESLRALMRFYLENGIRAFIAAGSTGQCYVLTEDEHRQIVRTIVGECKDYSESFVLGACSHTDTAVSNRLADICLEEGVNGLLMTAPYYRTHRDMCIIHYMDVANKHDIPLVIYHDNVMPEDIDMWDELMKAPTIMGVKYATANIAFGRQLVTRYRGRLAVLGGGGMLSFLPLALHGSKGYISSYANFLPEIENDFISFVEKNDFLSAAKIAEIDYDLFKELGNRNWFSFLVGLVNASGLPGKHCRPPLRETNDEEYTQLKQFISDVKKKHAKTMAELKGK
jgi:4-hydroxy-tetrahydrodipicolinate synthase